MGVSPEDVVHYIVRLVLLLATIEALLWAAASAADLNSVTLVQTLTANLDAEQCNGGAYGKITTNGGSFSRPMFLDTDNRSGGCNYQIGLVDPHGDLAKRGFKLTMQFSANGDPGQCGGIGTYDVPASNSMDHLRLTNTIFIDTDDRPGGCLLRWTLWGSNLVLDVNFYGNLDASQCGNQGSRSIQNGQSVELFLDMDNRAGGCFLSLRLRDASEPPVAAVAPPEKSIPPAVQQPTSFRKRVALVIGNGNYRSAPQLNNPPNDASDIAQALRKLGFDVVEGRDLDHAGMDNAIRQFGHKLPGADLALFFYAGHGLQVNGKNYLVPVDAKLEQAADLPLDTVDVDTVMAQMEAEKRVNLIFLDACRDNPFTRALARSLGTRSSVVGQGLAAIESAVGTMVTYSTQPNNVALDGDGRNSPFTAALLKYIPTPGLEIDELLKRVRADVVTTTHEKQTPWNHSSLVGDVVLAR
jgi:hypothetical protein